MRLFAVRLLRPLIFSCLVAAIALVTASFAHAQRGAVKPIGLVTGEVIPEVVTPAQVQVAPGDIFDGKYFRLIQFTRLPDDVERKGWEEAGLFLVDYLPDDTYFAVIDQRFDLNRLAGQVTTIIGVADVFRLEPRLAAQRAAGQPVDKLVVSYYATLDAAHVIADLKARGVVIEAQRDYARQLDIAIDPARLEEISARPYLQFLGPQPEEPVLEPYDYRNASGRSNYLNTGYNGLNYNGAGVVVGIGEGGTVDNLVDVKGRLTEMVVDVPSSHKIGVMQNAGGAGNLDPTNRNNAWGATFLSIEGTPDYAGLYTANNLRYTNHSYGIGTVPSGGYDSTARAHDLRIATLPNHLVIYSAGNSGTDTGYAPYNFATWATITGAMKMNKNMFAIGALSPDDVLTGFSSRGPMLDGRIIPQLVIEGAEGTSDAAPKVTGEVAQLAQVYKAKNGGAEPPSSLLRAIMLNTADDLGNAGPDFKHGYGRPNLRRAYNVIDSAQFLSSSVANGGVNNHTITVPANTKQVRVLIVWPDVAAAVNANPAIVNNLDLLVKDPSNTPYNPWVLDSSTPSSAVKLDTPTVRGVDSLNTIEQVTVDNPTAGAWTIQVSGANVPFGPQTYYVTYEFLGDELQMMFPLKDHRFVSGQSYQLKWDSYGGSGTFALDYQLDGGAWTNIVSGYDATSRTYSWTAPTVTGIHTLKVRVTRGALTSESDVNFIGPVPANFDLHWACADVVRLVWDATPGATSYKIYRLGAQTLEEVTSNITFDGTSAILTGQSTGVEYYAVSALTGTNEGLRTLAVSKATGDVNCFNIKTTVANSVDKTDVTLRGLVNPHASTLTNVHFEYGATVSYGSASSNISISASGHTEEAVSAAIASPLSSRSDVLHYRLVADRDGSPVYGVDQETRLAPGNGFTFDGVDDYINLTEAGALPIYRSGAGAGYSIAMWVKGSPTNGKRLYSEESSSGSGQFELMTYTNGQLWVYIVDDSGVSRRNALHSGTLFDNTWHHFVFVDQNGAITTYIDGAQASTGSYTPGAMTLNRAAIGASFDGAASNFFSGGVDEVSLWNKALTLAEIRDLMHQPLQGNESGLKAYYGLDEASNRVFNLVSGQEASIGGGNSTTASSAPAGVGVEFTTTEANGAVTWTGTGLSANYSSQTGKTVIVSRIDVEPNTTSGPAGNFTIFDNQYWVVHQHASGAFNANVTFTVSEDLTASDQSIPAQIWLLSRDKWSDGSWSFVATASSVNAATEQATFNGITTFNKQFMLARNNDPFLVTSPAALAFRNVKVGCGYQQLTYQLAGVNLSSDVSVTPPAGFLVSSDGSNFGPVLTLTPTAGAIVQTITVRFTPSTAGAYAGNIANSSTGAATYNVSITPFEALNVADYATRAMTFNGTTQYLDVPNFNWNPANVFTVEWWLKPNTRNNYNQSIGNGWGNFQFHANSDGSFSCGIANNTNSRINSAAGALVLNEWQHFAYVLNGANARLYRNGELVGEKTSSTGYNVNWGHFKIGDTGSNTINGQLDEFRMWSVARTQQQIKDDMHNVLTGSEVGLKLYLQFNAASGVAEDYSNNCYVVDTYNNPTRATSTAPVGSAGETVQTAAQTAVGDAGKQLKVTITSPAQPSGTDYLGIYRTGDGNTRVATGETFPSGVTQRASIFWGIREYGSVTVDLVIDYSGVPGVTAPSVIQLLKRSDAASAWTNVTGDWVRDDNARTFTKSGVTDFSEFSIGDNGQNPLAVQLADFSAVQQGDGILVTWETANEIDNRGFNLLRGTSPAGPDRQLNATLIPSQSQGNPGGFIYTWVDSADLTPGTTYDYWLETVSIQGATARYGPVSAAFVVPTAVTLTSVQAGRAWPVWLTLAPLLLAGGLLAFRRRRAD